MPERHSAQSAVQGAADEVKLLLIDPKVVEFQIYDDLPHLVHPVVSDMELARNALMWAVDEMERRYALLNLLSVRKLDDYNRKVREMDDPRSREGEELSPLPYIVIVVDEFGDLILNKGKEIESAIARLGQKARAAGIHIILATQSPRADVVTGLIKANLPSRIAFRTSGPTESRIIIDQGGAEALLGNGDMLLKASNGKLHRLHGAYVSDAEVESVVGTLEVTPDSRLQAGFPRVRRKPPGWKFRRRERRRRAGKG